jgi:predicted  nucleic acid-binding Zn-ribbon protein
VKADPARQLRLLDLQALDSALAQIAHQRAHLPAAARVEDLTGQVAAARNAVVIAETAVSDIAKELARSEGDVQLVRDRAARDRARLDSGTGTPKDLQALQHELVTLARRQSELEEIELEVMERAEAADAHLAALREALAGLEADLAATITEREQAYADLAAAAADTEAPRPGLVEEVGADLVALYDKLRSAKGVGVAALRQRRCLGCQLEVNAADLAAIRSAPADEVVRCEECGRILVRTPESGL